MVDERITDVELYELESQMQRKYSLSAAAGPNTFSYDQARVILRLVAEFKELRNERGSLSNPTIGRSSERLRMKRKNHILS